MDAEVTEEFLRQLAILESRLAQPNPLLQKRGPYVALSAQDIAQRLGYLLPCGPRYINEEAKLIDIALRGSYCMWFEWTLTTDTQALSRLWDEFLSRRECLRCHCRAERLSFMKPFCIKCYRVLKADEEGKDTAYDWEADERVEIDTHEEVRVTVDETEKQEQRIAFSWLNQIPSWEEGQPCFGCRNTHLKRSSPSSVFEQPSNNTVVWWFGDMKAICAKCIHNVMVGTLEKPVRQNMELPSSS